MARSEVALTLSQCRGFNFGFAPSLSSSQSSCLSQEFLALSLTSGVAVVFVVPFSEEVVLGLGVQDNDFLDTWIGVGIDCGGGGGGGGVGGAGVSDTCLDGLLIDD